MLRYQWKIGEVMKFLVLLTPVDNNFKKISGYLFNNTSNKWELISQWKTHRSKGELSQATSFVEDFRRNYDSIKHERSAEFGPYYVMDSAGTWKLSKTVSFCADETPSKYIAAKVVHKGKSTFMLTTGGKIKMKSDLALFQKMSLSDEETEAVPTQYLNDLISELPDKEA